MKASSLIYGILTTLAAYFFFAVSGILVKTFPASFPTIEIVFFQNFISFIALLFILKIKNVEFFKTSFWGTHLIRDLSGLVSYFLYFLAIKKIGIVDATVLSYTAPFYIPFICHFWLKEKLFRQIWWVVILGFIGMSFILKPQIASDLKYLIGIAAGIATAIAIVAIGVLNKKEEPLQRTLFYFFLISALVVLPFTIAVWQTPTHLQMLSLLGIGSSIFIGQCFLTSALDHGHTSILAPLCYSIVVFAMILNWLFFQKVPDLFSFLGSMIIILGGTLTFIFKKKDNVNH